MHNGGRKVCIQQDPVFRKMEGDLHNLRPSIGEVNRNRSNYPYGIVANKQNRYGSCKSYVNFKSQIFEPRDEVKGDVARITLYMNHKYTLNLNETFLHLMLDWSAKDPATDEEREINRRIQKAQGDANPFIK
jgi:deoxyribonuclease-1